MFLGRFDETASEKYLENLKAGNRFNLDKNYHPPPSGSVRQCSILKNLPSFQVKYLAIGRTPIVKVEHKKTP